MIGFEILRPHWVWWLFLAPIALAVGLMALERTRRELARWVSARMRASFLPGHSPGRARARLALAAAALFFLGLAALGPVRGYTYRAVARKGLDLVVCIDTSRSMLAQDLRPSRLERARREVVGLLDRLRGDRVALVAFSGEARDVAPLTRDRATLEGLLGYLTPEDNQEGGTDLSAALEHGLALLQGRSGAHEAIVLLTDGEDLAGKTAEQVAEAQRRGIRVFVVGVGTEAGGKIPIVDASGSSSFLRGPDGEEVVTRLEGESLATLARSTGGEYLSAEQSPTPLEDLYRARITRIQGREIEGGERRVPYDRFQWPLGLALACLLLELGLTGSRRAARPRGAALGLPVLLPLLLAGEEPFSPAAALGRAVERHAHGESAEAEAAARSILEAADGLGLGELERARAHYALGVITATRALAAPEDPTHEADRQTAREAFLSARALAGPGALRQDATYDLGALELAEAERLRARLPEIAGPGTGALAAPGAAPTPGLPGVPPAEGASDPLPLARTLYQNARTWLVERLRLDWNDLDTRADLELVQRRLHELDEIEKRREEEKQKESQQKSDKDDENTRDDSSKNSDTSDEGKPDEQDQKDEQDKQDQKQKQDGSQDGNPDQAPEQRDAKDHGDPEDDPSKPKEPQQEPPPQPGQDEPPGQDQEQPAPDPRSEDGKASERVLTREEVMQLLDKLAELEKRQKALAAALRARQYKKAARDW